MICNRISTFDLIASVCFLISISVCPNNAKDFCPFKYKQIGDKYCYRLKEKEKFDDVNVDCNGNAHSIDIMEEYNLTLPHKSFWTSYKNIYPGGYYLDINTGESLSMSKYHFVPPNPPNLNVLNLDLCLVWDSDTKSMRAVDCAETHWRYCIIDISSDNFYDKYATDGCGERNEEECFVNVYRMPRVFNLFLINERVTWDRAQKMCYRRKSRLLQKGWIYARNMTNNIVPLGAIGTNPENLRWSDPDDEFINISPTEGNFGATEPFSADMRLLALNAEGLWKFVNDSSIFSTVICELPVNRTKTIKAPSHENATTPYDHQCFTDSNIITAQLYSNVTQNAIVSASVINDDEVQVDMKADGYYWCKEDYKLFGPKHLYIKNTTMVENRYALRVELKSGYKTDIFENDINHIFKSLSFLIFLYNEYLKQDEKTTLQYTLQKELREYQNSHNLTFEKGKTVYNKKSSKLKRIYLDNKTLLIHMDLLNDIKPLPHIIWEGMTIIYMKPTLYCKGLDSFSDIQVLIDESYTENCTTYKCVGNYDEGVQFAEESVDGCKPAYIPELKTEVEVYPDFDNSSSESSDEYIDSTVSANVTTWDNFTTDSTAWDTVSTDTLPTITMTSTEFTSETPTPETTMLTLPPRPPQQQVDDVLQNLENLLNTTKPIPFTEIDHVFDDVNSILEITDEVMIPGNFLTMLDQMGSRADLNGSNRMTTVRNNVALVVAASQPNKPVIGLRIASRTNDAFKEEAFHILSDRDNKTHLEEEASEAVVYLPNSVATSEKRISFVVFRDERPFMPARDHIHYNVNSRVLSINVEDLTVFDDGEAVEIHLRPISRNIQRNESRSCGYWSFMGNGTGIWSQEGCVFIPSNDGLLDMCRCTHLTHFAEVLVPRNVFPEAHETALEYLSIIGCSISLFGLGIIALTAISFRAWRNDFNNKIWLNLCFAIFLLITSFFVVAFANFEHYNLPCMFTGIMLHYSVICSFCWMLVAAVISYRRLVLVFTRDASHKLLRAAAFAYGVPFAVFGVLLSIDPLAYANRFEETMPSGSFCYPSGLALWLTVYVPVAIMLLANCTLFALIMRSVFGTKKIQRHGDANDAIRCATVSCLLVFMFGLPWIFGLFAYMLVFAYLFALTATFQGFVLFIFFVLGNKKTRELWMNKLKIKQSRKLPVSSSTGYRVNTDTIEASSSKPRSLGSSDNSRFS